MCCNHAKEESIHSKIAGPSEVALAQHLFFQPVLIDSCVLCSREVAGNFSNSNVETQPPMMSFKSFLGTQEDTITDEEAIKRYNEYKLEFRRQQLNEFFVAHKDEEWYISFDTSVDANLMWSSVVFKR